jgi:hypothetical protein
MKKSPLFFVVLLMLMLMLIVGLPLTAAAGAEYGTDARDCTLATKQMSQEMTALSAYLNGGSAKRTEARGRLTSAESSLARARAACRPFPEMTPILDGLALEVDRIDGVVQAP